MNAILAAYERHKAAADSAFDMLAAWTREPLPRVPGCDTRIRLAVRIDSGRTVEAAAAREYCYRWALALQSPIFGVPHALGM